MMSLRSGPVVFAVEDTGAQVTWRTLPDGEITFRCADREATVHSDGGPGTADLRGLEPATSYRVEVRQGPRRIDTFEVRTLPRPPGEELYRFATLSDLHLGRTRFGVRHRIFEADVEDAHPIRCSRAALDDLVAWGARRLVIKGDLVDANTDACWALARGFAESIPVPWHVLPGNHEVAHGGREPVRRAAAAGIDLVTGVTGVDVPGLRLLLMNSTVEGIDVGRYSHLREEAAEAAGGADGPAMLLTHHQPQLLPFPHHFPLGIDSVSAGRFVRALASANPATIGSSGHTHRNRVRTISGVPWSEVGSPKDYPGGWAGYVVHEGGIRQVVRRVTDPDCLRWLDRTRHAAYGLWGVWSPGGLSDRCFTHVWPPR